MHSVNTGLLPSSIGCAIFITSQEILKSMFLCFKLETYFERSVLFSCKQMSEQHSDTFAQVSLQHGVRLQHRVTLQHEGTLQHEESLLHSVTLARSDTLARHHFSTECHFRTARYFSKAFFFCTERLFCTVSFFMILFYAYLCLFNICTIILKI